MASLQEVTYDPLPGSAPPTQADTSTSPQTVTSDQGRDAYSISRAPSGATRIVPSGATRIVPSSQSSSKLQPVDYDPFANMPVTDAPVTDAPVTVSGLLKATGTGLARSGMMAAGMGGDVQALGNLGSDYLSRKFEETFPDAAAWLKTNALASRLKSETARTMQSPLMQGVAETGGDVPGIAQLPSTADIQGAVEGAAGTEFHTPQNAPERYLQTTGEFTGAALGGPGGILSKIARVAVPAVASQTAGELTAGTPYEPYARTGAALLTGGATALATRPGGAANIIRGQLPEGITAAHIDQAGQMIADNARRGIDLPWSEAVSQVTGQPVLTDTMRMLESHPATRARLQSYYANRPQQFDQAAMDELHNITPPTTQPGRIGPQASKAAIDTLQDIRNTINKYAKPFYQASGGVQLTPAEMTHVKAIPNWTEARDAVRNGKNSWRVAHLPDNSVGFLNAVKKYFDEAALNAASKFNRKRSQETKATYESAASAVKQIGELKSPHYQAALAIEAQERFRHLDPRQQSYLGELAKKDLPTKRAINALFPSDPLGGSHHEISETVSALAKRNLWAARQLVRAHIEKVFNEATQSLQGGPSQWGAAKFAAVLTGNAQQRENLRAAIEALPNGKNLWKGFEGFLDAAEATGHRQAIGSRAAFDVEELKALSGSNFLGETVKTGLSPGKWWTVVKDKWDNWSQGRNMNQLAAILTDPDSAKLLTRIAQMPRGSREAQYIASRLILQADAAAQSRR